MRAATRERITTIMALVLVISIGFPVPKAPAQSTAHQTWAERFRVMSALGSDLNNQHLI
jgi:hypothetical protein